MAVYTFSEEDDFEEIYALTDFDEFLEDRHIVRYRAKTIRSGDIVECEVYPIWNTRSSLSRAKKMKKSREAQRSLNERNAKKKVYRLINANFSDNDIWATFTYDNKHLPKSAEEAGREMAKYIRRLRRYAAKHGFPPLKYVYVTEFEDDPLKKKKRIHHHIVMNFPDRDVAERLWAGGARRNTRRLQRDESGYEGLGRYIMKDPRGTKHYVCSQNLIKPTVTFADFKFSRKKVKRLAMGEADPEEEFRRLYRGCRLTAFEARESEYVSGYYIYAKMLRIQRE